MLICFTYESNVNGQFSSHFGLIVPTLVTVKVKWKISFFCFTFSKVYLYAKVEQIQFF